MRRGGFLRGALAVGAAATVVPEHAVLRIDAAPLGHDVNPYRDAEIGVDELAWLYADGLVGWNDGIVPLLAEALPRAAQGGRRWSYRLRPALWHDGRALRAADVASALAALRATPWSTRQPYRSIERIVITGERDFDVHLASPRTDFAETFFGAYGTPALPLIRSTETDLPIGTGPFRIVGRPERERWRLEPWRGSPRGASSLGAIDLRLISSELTATVQMLSGEADIVLPFTAPPGDSRFRRYRRYTSTAVLLLETDGILHEAAVRRALAASIDLRALQRSYDPRRTNLLATLLPSGRNDPGFEEALARDPAAGVRLRDRLGDRPLVLAYVRESRSHERTMTLLQQMLGDVGVRSELHPVPARIYTGLQGPLRTGRFDIAIAGFAYGAQPDIGADWSCAARPPAGGNFARWCDPAFDAAAKRGDVPAALRRLYDAVACVPLSHAYEDIGVSPRVSGFEAPQPLVPATYDCSRWTITSL